MKSACGSRRPAKVRRKTDIKDLERADVRYIWAAYRQGGLRDFDPIFETKMEPDEFTQLFAEHVAANYQGPAWLLSGQTVKGFRPLGFVLTLPRGRRVIEIGAIEWFPWAGRRAVLEAVVNLFNALRQDYTVLEFAHIRDDEFFKRHVASRGVLRRVGVVHGIYPDAPAVLYQTRRYGEWK